MIYCDKVDGLIRLMAGSDTGPINLGNPGYIYIARPVYEYLNCFELRKDL